ncbi:MAG: hypothetical protein M3323_11125 [Actinomycetota bacterium]|nr:hypothetical protein [Actinomycetota bacterium]
MDEREQVLTEEGRARRHFLKQAGTVAWASPLIVTMMSRAAQAAPGDPCGTIGPTPGVCVVTTPCGSVETCLPDPLSPGDCACQTNP